MSMTIASPHATALLSPYTSSRHHTEESTEIWVSDTLARFTSDCMITSFVDRDSIRVSTRSVREAGTTRTSRSIDDEYVLVIVNAIESDASYEPGDPTAVAAIAALKNRLGVSERDIEKAAGIKHSTHQHWKRNPDTQPRAGSQGGLWSLLATVEELEAFLGSESAATWLKKDPARRAALKDGCLSRYVDAETGALRTTETARIRLEISESTEMEFDGFAPPGRTVKARSWSTSDFKSKVGSA